MQASHQHAHVLVHHERKVAIKICELDAEKKFADFCIENPTLSLPNTERVPNPLEACEFDCVYIAEMSLLTKLKKSDRAAIETWYKQYLLHRQNSESQSISDQFGLLETLNSLYERAAEVKPKLGVDFKPDNVMQNDAGAYIIIDGFMLSLIHI